ncbi:O-sialoglycoprotein endopeptidase [Heliobacillus mobilis]|uniref:N(6)-L-threonylcarbamoyladenine synthase n=1 Tax=Heliobacterium mobile TaxID=28064 RepID=A0A6I3SKW7_HELMO|nr:O-sialoglycoprotein endopeptidase [Heliobacterium mobile]MTV49332.1 O-sialoglycoprotein endopeptidase [Heliobacterium mobile]
MRGILGFDTSCYTTSLAFVDDTGQLRAQRRRLLPVKPGERGLRQGDAFFLHGQQLPELMEDLFAELYRGGQEVRTEAVSVSTRPRPEEGSYLPVFRAGEAVGRSLAASMNIPFFATSHQEGHLMAGLFSLENRNIKTALLERDFLAVHLSGGTTELLQVRPCAEKTAFEIHKMGGTMDLHAGQLVDRVGVALGLPFPAGPHLERLAAQCDGPGETFPASVKKYAVSFSGTEAQALRLIDRYTYQAGNNRNEENPRPNQKGVEDKVVLETNGQGERTVPIGPAIARGIERCLASTLEKVLRQAIEETGIQDVLIVGGVAANQFLRQRLKERLEHRAVGGKLYFATPELSGDNAVGVAALGYHFLKNPNRSR